jgi:hypothetical protein
MATETKDTMVVVDGVRYQRADAERLGLLGKDGEPTGDKPKADTKARPVTSNKARTRSGNK